MSDKPSDLIDRHISELKDWRGPLASKLRKAIKQAGPGLQEEWKWGTPVFTSNGNVVALGVFKESVKLNFFKGASLPDPHGLFNGGLDAKTSRSIDLGKGDAIDDAALKELVRAAVAANAKKR